MTSSSIASRRGRRLEPEHVAGLAHVGDASLDVVLERRIAHEPERPPVGVDLAPDRLGQLEHRRRGGRREVEVLVDRGRRLHRQADPVGQVATVGVVADLVAGAEDVERVLALQALEHEIRDDVRERQLDVAAHDVGVAACPTLADADAVERPDDRERQAVLLLRPGREVFGRELLEPVGRDGWRRRALRTLGGREDRRRLVDHRARHHDDPLEVPVAVGRDGGIERRGQDPLVLGQQVVGELVEVADAADHRRRGDDLVAVGRERPQQPGVLRVALHEPVAGMVVVRTDERPVLAEVVDADDVVAGLEQLGDEIAVDEAGGAGDEDLHVGIDLLPEVADIEG